jgi:hypothetical protein
MRVVAVAVLLVACAYAYAQDAGKGAATFQAEGRVTDTAHVREAPPYGPFNLFIGGTMGSVDKGTEVKIIDKKTYSGFDGTHVWYQIEPLERQAGKEPTRGWIYGGVEGKDPQVKLEKIK